MAHWVGVFDLSWAAVIGLLVGVAILFLAVLAAGIYQVLTARPSPIPLDRLLRKRLPAGEVDCVRQGAATILSALAFVLIEGPVGVVLVSLRAELDSTPSGHPSSLTPVAIGSIVLMGSAVVSLALQVVAYVISRKIRYVPIVADPPWPTGIEIARLVGDSARSKLRPD